MTSATRPMPSSDLSSDPLRAKAGVKAEDVVGDGVALPALWMARLMVRKKMLSLITSKSTLTSQPSLKRRMNLPNRDYTPRQ